MMRQFSGLVLVLLGALPLRAADSFAGTWETTFGRLVLTQKGDEVKGTYQFAPGAPCTLEGKVEKNKLTFTYKEPDATGEGWFQLSPDGRTFEGKWRQT